MLEVVIEKPRKLSAFEVLFTFLRDAPETRYRKERALGFLLRKRVMMLDKNWWIVESKKYPNKPSRFYRIHVTTAHNIILCECEHVEFRGKTDGLCSHGLAVSLMMSIIKGQAYTFHFRDPNDINAENARDAFDSKILLGDQNIKGNCVHCKSFGVIFTRPASITTDIHTYTCEKCGFVYTPDRFQRLIVFNLAYADMKLTGGEWWPHIKNKKRIRDLLEKNGFINTDYEKIVHCRNHITGLLMKYPFFLDVYGEKVNDGKIYSVGVEVHGKKGHGTPITIPQDRNRKELIESQTGINVIEFWIENLETARDEDILNEIYQKIGL